LEVNVAINIKVETLFWGANVFREGGAENTGDFVLGETLFRDRL